MQTTLKFSLGSEPQTRAPRPKQSKARVRRSVDKASVAVLARRNLALDREYDDRVALKD